MTYCILPLLLSPKTVDQSYDIYHRYFYGYVSYFGDTMAALRETEKSSNYDHLESMSVRELLVNINREDKTVPDAVEKVCV